MVSVLLHTNSDSLVQFTAQREHLGRVVDFVVTVGGDGTILHVSSLFQKEAPPILSFSKGGTLGFLVPYNILIQLFAMHVSSLPLTLAPISDYKSAIRETFEGGFSVTRRMRLQTKVHHLDSLSGLPTQTDLGTP